MVNLLSLNIINYTRLADMISLTHTHTNTHATQVPGGILVHIFWVIPASLQHVKFKTNKHVHLSFPLFAHFAVLIPFLLLLILFLPSILFHLQLSIQTRSEVIKRATKALRQLGEKSRKRAGDGSGEKEGTDPAGMTFDEALTHLQQSQAHLDTLSHAVILSLKDSQQVDPIFQTL